MRAKTKIYHVRCFQCSACGRELKPGKFFFTNSRTCKISVKLTDHIYFIGDEFALREGGSLYCKDDHDVLEKSAQIRLPLIIESNNNTNLSNNNHSSELGSMSGKHSFFSGFLKKMKE